MSLVQAKELDTFKVLGTCALQKTEVKEVCMDDDPDSPTKFDRYELTSKPSDNVKMKSEPCPQDQIKNYLALKPKFEPSIGLEKPENPFEAVGCSIISENDQYMVIFESHSKATTKESGMPDYNFGQILFIKSDKTGAPKGLIKTVSSVDTAADSRSRSSVYAICDVDNDNKAEIIIYTSLYYYNKFNVLKINPNFSEMTEKIYENTGCAD